MKGVFSILLLSILALFYSCDLKKNNEVKKRTVRVFYDSIFKIENYVLNIKETDSSIVFHYNNIDYLDLEWDMNFEFLVKNRSLIWGGEEYVFEKELSYKIPKLSKTDFNSYQLKERVMDGTGPILFNHEYGVLGIGNVLGPEVIFYPNPELSEMDEYVLKILYD